MAIVSVKRCIGRGGKLIPYEVDPNQLNALKEFTKFHCLKSQPILSKASQMEWPQPFDFLTRIPVFFHVNALIKEYLETR